MADRELEDNMSSMNLNDSLLTQLKCPVCLETCKSPIFMCLQGHNICSTCKEKVKQCPVCRTPDSPSIRNRFAEATRAKLSMPCKFKHRGCDFVANLPEMEKHIDVCQFNMKRLVVGRFNPCEFFESQVSLLKHFKKFHLTSLYLSYYHKTMDHSQMLKQDEIFWFHRRYSAANAKCYFYLQRTDPKNKDSALEMELIITSDDGRSDLRFIRSALDCEDDYKVSKNTVVLSLDNLVMIAGGNPCTPISYTVNLLEM